MMGRLASGGRRQRGFSLVEALVALAVMAIGMLGLVGVQSTLRQNSDGAKQRAEAVRLAQEKIEQLRAYVALAPLANQVSYNPSLNLGTTSESITPTVGNTTYTREWIVSDMPLGRQLVVNVTWSDRSGTQQKVRLDTMITQVAPVLTGTVHIPPGVSSYQTPQGRNRAIPQGAKAFPDGTSGFIPPGTTGIAWRFDNSSGVITLCTTTATTIDELTQANITNCTAIDRGILVWGFVRFTGPTSLQPGAAEVRNANAVADTGLIVRFNQTAPSGFVDTGRPCYQNVVAATVTNNQNYIEYYCLALTTQTAGSPPTPIDGNVWLDAANITPLPAEFSPTQRRACRFFNPSTYTQIREPQVNQNFVVIAAGDGALPFRCTINNPTSPPTQLTWPHQPATDPT